MTSVDEAKRLYGTHVVRVLTELREAISPTLDAIVDQFVDSQIRMPDAGALVASLSPSERPRLKEMQRRMILAISTPELTAAHHHELASSLGRRHASIGLSSKDLAFSHEVLLSAVREHVQRDEMSDGLSVFGSRLMRDLALQLEAYQRIERERHAILADVTHVAWTTKSYADLFERFSERLCRHDEVAGVVFGRVDRDGTFQFEAGSEHLAWLGASEGRAPSDGEEPIGRAWRSGRIERCVNVATDPTIAAQRDLFSQHGIRSIVVIPVRPAGSAQGLILGLASALPGGFGSAHQALFVEQLKTLLELAVSRIEGLDGRMHSVPYPVRRRWSALLRTDALELHYQPLLDVARGRIVKLEALARLRDGDRLLPPSEFFPALSPDDFVELYASGLGQALRATKRWLERGLDLGVSINLPASALSDPRYLELTRSALRACGCSPERLTLELLESGDASSGIDVSQELMRFKELGVVLAEDDLGSGYSSLARLREMPFDAIKIDRSITRRAADDPSDTLRFIYQLTRLGHSLGKEVIVEGVEDRALLDAVTILGVDAVQGWAVARPMPERDVAEWTSGYDPSAPSPNGASPLAARLAELVVWEERLHSALQGRARGASTIAPEIVPERPFALVDAALQDALVAAATRHRTSSVQYRIVREQLVRSLQEAHPGSW